MKRIVATFFAGLSLSVIAAYVLHKTQHRRQAGGGLFDLNQCSKEDLRSLKLEESTVERIIESRPYRSKLELVSRVLLPSEIYDPIKNRVSVSNSQEPVKVA
jgi:hypothetical protein